MSTNEDTPDMSTNVDHVVSHDPLCPFAPWPDEDCYQRDAGVAICELLAEARVDERHRAAARANEFLAMSEASIRRISTIYLRGGVASAILRWDRE